VPQRAHKARPAPARADSIGSENSKSSVAACTGVSSDADAAPPRPKKVLASAASILVSFSGA